MSEDFTMTDTNGWETYSKLVIQQLETLPTGIEGLRTELQDVKNQMYVRFV